MKVLTAADRNSLIRLAASLPKGDKSRRAILAGLKKAENWIDEAIRNPGRLHEYFGVPEGEKIPVSKIDAEIKKLKSKEDRTEEETSLLRALNLAKTLKKMGGGRKKAESLADLPDAPLGYEWDTDGDAFVLLRRGQEVGSVMEHDRGWLVYDAGEGYPVGRAQDDIFDAATSLLEHLGLL